MQDAEEREIDHKQLRNMYNQCYIESIRKGDGRC